MKPQPPTVDALIEALTAATGTPADGSTVRELATKTGRSVVWVRGELRRLIFENKAEPVRLMRPRLDGLTIPCPGYRLKNGRP